MGSKTKNDLGTSFPEALEGNVLHAKYFFFETAPNCKEGLAVVFGGHERCAPDFEIQRDSYPYYVIEIPIKGKCVLQIGKKTHILKRGTIGGFAPGTAHHYKCNHQSPMEHFFITFLGTEAKKLFEMSTLASKGVIEIPNPSETIYLAETILKKGLEKTKNSLMICNNYLRIMFLELAHKIAESGDSSMSLVTYKGCKKYIDENFSWLLYPRDVADEFSITVRHMSRLFKQYGQTTPHEYIMRLKMNKASVLLLTSNMIVKRIATLVGFEDQYHFSRNFKKFYDYSPQEYRKIHI
jgi:AraC-like DNA-binding protein